MSEQRAQTKRVDDAKAQGKRLSFNKRGTLSPEKGGPEQKEVGKVGQFWGVGQGTEVIHA